MLDKIGEIRKDVIEVLGILTSSGTPIYIGHTNIRHMANSHKNDYLKYGKHIRVIVNDPDFVGLNPKDGSIEYVKVFKVDNDFVKVAVRVSSSGRYFARSLYVLNSNRVNNFIKKGTDWG